MGSLIERPVNTAAQADPVEVDPSSLQRLSPRWRLTELAFLYREEKQYVFEFANVDDGGGSKSPIAGDWRKCAIEFADASLRRATLRSYRTRRTSAKLVPLSISSDRYPQRCSNRSTSTPLISGGDAIDLWVWVNPERKSYKVMRNPD